MPQALLVPALLALSGFVLSLSWSNITRFSPVDGTNLTSGVEGWRVDMLDLALCAVAAPLTWRAWRSSGADLPRAERPWLWLVTALIVIKLLTAVTIYR